MQVSEKQSLLNVVQNKIAMLEIDLAYVKVAIKMYYKLSDKNKPETLEYFKELNRHQDIKRNTKAKISRLAKIAKTLKEEISKGV